MKKKLISLVISAAAAGVLLGGCNLFAPDSREKETETTKATETTQTTTVKNGDVVEKDGVRKTIVYNNDSPGVSGSTGGIEYSIDSVQIADVITTTDTASRLLDLEKNNEAVMVTVSFSCKNTWEITTNFYISQAAIETDAGDEATPKSLYGEYMDGNFSAGASKSGSNVYIIKGVKADSIKSISFHVDAPADMDFKDVGEDVDVEIEIK